MALLYIIIPSLSQSPKHSPVHSKGGMDCAVMLTNSGVSCSYTTPTRYIVHNRFISRCGRFRGDREQREACRMQLRSRAVYQ